MEKIAVIIPVYNVEAFLERALKSITCQTYTNLQILLIDDGSTDESGRICDVWKERDSRIQCVHQRNGEFLSREIKGLILRMENILCSWMRMTG